MKKTFYASIYIVGIALIVFLAVYLIIDRSGDSKKLPEQQERSTVLSKGEKTSVTVYYLSENGQYLLPLGFDITATNEAAKVAVEKLLAGSPVADAQDVVLSDSKLVNFYSIGDNVFLDVTSEFVARAAEENPLALDALAATILPLSSGNQLYILVDGKQSDASFGSRSLAAAFGTPYLNLYGESLDLVASSGFAAEDYQAIVCYLPTESGYYLMPFTKLAAKEDLPDNTLANRARWAVEALLTMPQMEGILALPDPVPRLNDLKIEDNIAYCDFNDMLLSCDDKRMAQLFLRSLVRTLVSLEGISSVQLTVNGSIMAETISGVDIAHPLSADRAVNSHWQNSTAPTALPE